MNKSLDLKLWKLQRSSALLMFPLLVFHVAFLAFFVGIENVNYDNTAHRLAAGAYLVADVLLLLTVVTHAALGLRSILQDFAVGKDQQRWRSRIALVLFLALIGFGAFALSAFI